MFYVALIMNAQAGCTLQSVTAYGIIDRIPLTGSL
jgi:hypothetical protein